MVEQISDVIVVLFAFFDSLMGSLVLLGVMGVLMVCSLMLLSRSRKKSRARKAGSKQPVEPSFAQADGSATGHDGDSAASQLESEPEDADLALDKDAAAGYGGASSSGFTFFRRKGAKKTSSVIKDDDDMGSSAVKSADEDYLSAVEQEMLATRQLYLNGHISKDVYVSETRALYKRARERA